MLEPGGPGDGKVGPLFPRLRDAFIPATGPQHCCSISPAALITVFALLAAVTVGIGLGFAANGAWLVLPFAGLEALGLAIAFFAWARRAPGGALKGRQG